MPRLSPRLSDWLEALYARYHRREHVALDPLVTLYRFENVAQREVAGLIAAALAYGNVKAILKGIDSALVRTGPSPADYLRDNSPAAIRRDFRDFRYRVTGGPEMAALLVGVKKIIARHGGLDSAFASHLSPGDQTVIPALGSFVEELYKSAGRELLHLIPHPSRGSACKRSMLYLRWMVRSDAIDPGGWSSVRASQLVVPLDTHLHHMSRLLKLTRRKQPNLRTALEITAALRSLRADDPLRYDFSLTRPGILRHPPPRFSA